MKMNWSLWPVVTLLLLAASLAPAQEAPKKELPLPGEVFLIDGRTAFVIPAKIDSVSIQKPWVWYAPTLPNLPGKAEHWMFEEFTRAGIAIAGIDAGESYGSPVGNRVFDSLYAEMTKRGYSPKPVLLGRSRGGLQTLSWATSNPEKVGAFAGIYPVCDLASYPGVDKAAGAFEMSPDELRKRLKEFTPIDRLEGLAKARVPLFAIHGDVDTVVPLEANSGLMKDRFTALGGSMELIAPAGQGHNMWSGFFESSELVEFVKLHSGIEILLTSPLDYQVFQRHSEEVGRVWVRGTLCKPSQKLPRYEYRLLENGKDSTWKKLIVHPGRGGFSASFSAPAGGWRRFELRASVEGTVIAQTSVEHVGVGEIFVVAGQSNSANHGEERQTVKTDRVVTFDGRFWHIANDPQPGASGEGGSFIPPLGDALAQKFEVPIAFVSCGIGATSVREWLREGTAFPNPPTIESNVQKLDSGGWASKGEIYDRFNRRMFKLGSDRFRAVLWHQGESDANQTDKSRSLSQTQYRSYLEKLITDSRARLDWRVPWFVAQASYHAPGDESDPAIRAAQASLWRDGVALEGPDTDALKGDLRDSNGRGVHFSGRGLRELAKRWEEKISPWLQQQIEAK